MSLFIGFRSGQGRLSFIILRFDATLLLENDVSVSPQAHFYQLFIHSSEEGKDKGKGHNMSFVHAQSRRRSVTSTLSQAITKRG